MLLKFSSCCMGRVKLKMSYNITRKGGGHGRHEGSFSSGVQNSKRRNGEKTELIHFVSPRRRQSLMTEGKALGNRCRINSGVTSFF